MSVHLFVESRAGVRFARNFKDAETADKWGKMLLQNPDIMGVQTKEVPLFTSAKIKRPQLTRAQEDAGKFASR